jgi:serine-type D-Ala-D-Ala carboxypeptidase (penicillin-binding protein 5/6)
VNLLPDALLNPIWLEPVVELRSLTTRAGVIMEDKTKKVLWQRDPHTPRYPASTTKIMTTLLMLENMKPDDLIIAPKDVNKIGEASMNLKPGEKVRVKNMAYAMMLRSANDGCYAVAVTMDGSVSKFAKRMNDRAKQMGCQNTNFVNPNGLNSKTHTISAYDLCLVGREAMQREDFREVVKTRKKLIDRSINFSDRWMISKNKILWKDPSADGIKTGYTNPAGHTYVGSAKRGETRVITSILNASSWQADQLAMLKWAFDHYETKKLRKAQEFDLSEIGGPEGISAKPKSDIYVCVKKSGDRVTEVFEPLTDKVDLKPGDTVGHDIVTDSDGFVQKIELVVGSSMPPVVGAKSEGKNQSRWALFACLGGIVMVCSGFLLKSFLRSRPRVEVPAVPHPSPSFSLEPNDQVEQ